MARNRLGRLEAEKRIGLQIPLSEKEVLADFVIQNNGTVEDLRHSVREFLELIQKKK